MKFMAHIIDGKVVNISKWDGVSEWNPTEEVIEIPTQKYKDNEGETKFRALAGIGWDYVNGDFIDNRPKETEDY